MNCLIRWTPLLCAFPVLTSCSTAPAPGVGATPAPSAARKSFVTKDGLKITPLEVHKDDVAKVIGVEMWKFKVEFPKTSGMLQFKMELRQPGKSPKSITGFGVGPGPQGLGEVLVALYPLNGPFTDAQKIRTYFGWSGGSTANVIDNPLKGLGGNSYGPPQSLNKDGSMELMAFSKNGRFPHPANSLVVLTLKTSK